MADKEKYDLEQFLTIKLVTGEEIFVADMFEPGEILEDATKTVCVVRPMRTMVRELESGNIHLTLIPWMLSSDEDVFVINKSCIVTYGPPREDFSKIYLQYLENTEEEDKPKLEEEIVEDKDLEFLKKLTKIKPKPRKKRPNGEE